MADWHLVELDDALPASGWSLGAVLPGDGYGRSAMWVITRGDRSTVDDDRVAAANRRRQLEQAQPL
jgi:hypothetical protein